MRGTLASRYLPRKKLGEPFGSPGFLNLITNSEREPRSNLDLPHDRIGSDAADGASTRTINAVCRLAQINVVERVEEFSSDLRPDLFCNAEVLEYGEIRIKEVRTS